MGGEDFNGVIDEMNALIVDQSEWTTKPNEDELVNELHGNNSFICV
jgi:hypothetical protein